MFFTHLVLKDDSASNNNFYVVSYPIILSYPRNTENHFLFWIDDLILHFYDAILYYN